MLVAMSRGASLHIGPIEVDPPVVLAPMAGVTDAPFRVLCASFGGGLFVNQMVTARALLEGHRASWELTRFHPAERVRSLQLYGTDPLTLGEAVRRLVAEDRVDHVDLNFGCPAAKVTRNGGGAALPYKRRLLRAIVRAAVRAAEAESAGRVPVTVKFRLGIDDDHLTYLETGLIAEEEGAAAVALHARTARQLYSGSADWEATARLKEAVTTIPVLGNGDIWVAEDAVEMMDATGCDGVVVGRGCLGRPWLFRDLADLFAGREPSPAPDLGEVAGIMLRHASLLADHFGPRGVTMFRRHTSWYLKGFPVGPALRDAFASVDSLEQLEDLIGKLDPDVPYPMEAARMVRGHSQGPRPVRLPHGFLEDRESDALPAEAEEAVSGG